MTSLVDTQKEKIPDEESRGNPDAESPLRPHTEKQKVEASDRRSISTSSESELTVGPRSSAVGPPAPGGPGAEKVDKNPFEVGWDGPDDPENPLNWGRPIRWFYTMVAGLLVFNGTFASSAPSGIVPSVERVFTFSDEVATLMISLFVGGYCVGPLLWGPLSENVGRRIVFIISFIIYTGFQVGCALSKNTGSLLVFRFLGGCAAASPLANSGGVIADMWDPMTRGKALAFFTLAPFAGPSMGPIVGGAIQVSGADWRWMFWVLTIFAGGCCVLVWATLPETYAPVILKWKAQRKRKETGDDRWYAPIELKKEKPLQKVGNILSKPFKLLALEPVLQAITLYMSFVYGCLYMLFESYPIVFGPGPEGRNFNEIGIGLMFLPIFIGGLCGAATVVFYFNAQYIKATRALPNGQRPPPEIRLRMAATGGVLFSIGFFWFGWTSYKSINYWAPMLSAIPVGMGLMFVFQGLFNYVIDTYTLNAATALSASTVVRSLFGAGFPMFATQMYKKLNPRWASTLVGCIAVLMIPIPVLFMRYGAALRARSRYSPTK